MNSREVLEQEIQHLKDQLKPRKAALAALIKLESAPLLERTPKTRFSGVKLLHAMRELLKASGKPIHKDELATMLIEGGYGIGKKRPQHNIEMSFLVNVRKNDLTQSKDGMIGLPEWSKKKK